MASKDLVDIADPAALRAYLVARGELEHEAQFETWPLTGGVSCKVMWVQTPERAFVVKQGLAQLAVKDDWFCDPARIRREHLCLAEWQRIVPDAVPELLFHDDEQYLYGMGAIPTELPTWKAQLLEGIAVEDTAYQVGNILGKIHAATAQDSAWREELGSQEFFYPLRMEAYLETLGRRQPRVAEHTWNAIEVLTAPVGPLVHGDYSPKNILVGSDRLVVLDFEVAHAGNPAFDTAFLLNHPLLKSVRRPELADAYLRMAQTLWSSYLEAARDGTDVQRTDRDTAMALPLLFLARVDGKSPVEYLGDQQRQQVRDIGFALVDAQHNTLDALFAHFKEALLKTQR